MRASVAQPTGTTQIDGTGSRSLDATRRTRAPRSMCFRARAVRVAPKPIGSCRVAPGNRTQQFKTFYKDGPFFTLTFVYLHYCSLGYRNIGTRASLTLTVATNLALPKCATVPDGTRGIMACWTAKQSIIDRKRSTSIDLSSSD
jgi:hypothetical protein